MLRDPTNRVLLFHERESRIAETDLEEKSRTLVEPVLAGFGGPRSHEQLIVFGIDPGLHP